MAAQAGVQGVLVLRAPTVLRNLGPPLFDTKKNEWKNHNFYVSIAERSAVDTLCAYISDIFISRNSRFRASESVNLQKFPGAAPLDPLGGLQHHQPPRCSTTAHRAVERAIRARLLA